MLIVYMYKTHVPLIWDHQHDWPCPKTKVYVSMFAFGRVPKSLRKFLKTIVRLKDPRELKPQIQNHRQN